MTQPPHSLSGDGRLWRRVDSAMRDVVRMCEITFAAAETGQIHTSHTQLLSGIFFVCGKRDPRQQHLTPATLPLPLRARRVGPLCDSRACRVVARRERGRCHGVALLLPNRTRPRCQALSSIGAAHAPLRVLKGAADGAMLGVSEDTSGRLGGNFLLDPNKQRGEWSR